MVTDLGGPDAEELYIRLSNAGFRRSHGLAYRPACPDCSACVAVRIVVDGFVWSRSFKRLMKANADLRVEVMPAYATTEQYRLFVRYQRSRHAGGDMSAMTFEDYQAMVEETPVDTQVVEFRDAGNRLTGIMLSDRLNDSLSAVYSCYDTTAPQRSLGTYMVLWLVERARAEGLPFVYLGYWVRGSEKMDYKVRFQPLEGLGPNGWQRIPC